MNEWIKAETWRFLERAKNKEKKLKVYRSSEKAKQKAAVERQKKMKQNLNLKIACIIAFKAIWKEKKKNEQQTTTQFKQSKRNKVRVIQQKQAKKTVIALREVFLYFASATQSMYFDHLTRFWSFGVGFYDKN